MTALSKTTLPPHPPNRLLIEQPLRRPRTHNRTPRRPITLTRMNSINVRPNRHPTPSPRPPTLPKLPLKPPLHLLNHFAMLVPQRRYFSMQRVVLLHDAHAFREGSRGRLEREVVRRRGDGYGEVEVEEVQGVEVLLDLRLSGEVDGEGVQEGTEAWVDDLEGWEE